jgi:hypothetical protein
MEITEQNFKEYQIEDILNFTGLIDSETYINLINEKERIYKENEKSINEYRMINKKCFKWLYEKVFNNKKLSEMKNIYEQTFIQNLCVVNINELKNYFLPYETIIVLTKEYLSNYYENVYNIVIITSFGNVIKIKLYNQLSYFSESQPSIPFHKNKLYSRFYSDSNIYYQLKYIATHEKKTNYDIPLPINIINLLQNYFSNKPFSHRVYNTYMQFKNIY